MKIISLWDKKGGCGKSTLAWSLAGAADHRGLKTLIIDEDPQGTCSMLAEDENVGFSVLSEWPKTQPDVDLVIVDMPPNTNTVPAGTVILPYQATRVSYSVAAKHTSRLTELCDNVIELIIQVDTRKENHKSFVKNNPTLQVKNRSIYERLTNEASSLFAPEFKNLSGARGSKKRNQFTVR